MPTSPQSRPITLHAHEVRAILAGRQTQLRRVVKLPKKETGEWHGVVLGGGSAVWSDGSPAPQMQCIANKGSGYCIACPFGGPGDLLWCRETFGFGWASGERSYSALIPTGSDPKKPDKVFYKADSWDESQGKHCWRPSSQMPRWASRLTLAIDEVRVERIMEMTPQDVVASGFPFHSDRDAYSAMWDADNGKGAWQKNDFVWVLNFPIRTPA